MKPPKPGLIRAVQTAARLRAAGYAWSMIAEELHRDEKKIRRWFHRYPDIWTPAYQAELSRVMGDAAAEGILVLRRLAYSEDEKIRRDAARVLVAMLPDSRSDDTSATASNENAGLIQLLQEVEKLDESDQLALAEELLVVRDGLARGRAIAADEERPQ